MKSAADVLEDAADYIERHGWTRRRMLRDDRVCVMGAIKYSQGMGVGCGLNYVGKKYRRATKRLVEVVYDQVLDHIDPQREQQPWAASGLKNAMNNGAYGHVVAMWNDQIAKNKQEVLDTLRRAAKEERIADERR